MTPVYEKRPILQARSIQSDCFNCQASHLFLWIEIEELGWRGCCNHCGVLFDGQGRILRGTKRFRASEGTKRTIRQLYKAFTDGEGPVAYILVENYNDE